MTRMIDSERPSVLVVESDPDIRRALRHEFSRAGFDVCTAGNGRTGLGQMRHTQVDAVVCESRISGMSAETFRKRLVGMPTKQDLPFFFLTTPPDGRGRNADIPEGAAGCVTKPFAATSLVALVEAVLEKRRATERASQERRQAQPLGRERFERMVSAELEKLSHLGGEASLVFIDVESPCMWACANDETDRVMTHLAETLQEACEDAGIVGHWDFSEFLMYLRLGSKAAASIVGRVIVALKGTALSSEDIHHPVSIGIAEAPRHGRDFHTLCRCADQAAYQSRREGGGHPVVFHPVLGRKREWLPWTRQAGSA
ncbi:MAG: diguanylate cyclase [Planctomycetes bacterium]|nr:diguanylate cyclase [Planctomycetota bacterium]